MSKPLIIFFAGPNGSGKSTITRLMPSHGVYVNADDYKKEYNLTDIEAAQKAEAIRNKLVDKKCDFSFETVLSTERNLHLLQKAKKIGYKIQCIYVLTCNFDINIARVKSRFLEGGHDVPVNKIKSRYIKALNLLPKIIEICDKFFLYDNSIMPSLIFKKDQNGYKYFPIDIWPLEKIKNLIK